MSSTEGLKRVSKSGYRRVHLHARRPGVMGRSSMSPAIPSMTRAVVAEKYYPIHRLARRCRSIDSPQVLTTGIKVIRF